jgi:hypothetical protein
MLYKESSSSLLKKQVTVIKDCAKLVRPTLLKWKDEMNRNKFYKARETRQTQVPWVLRAGGDVMMAGEHLLRTVGDVET